MIISKVIIIVFLIGLVAFTLFINKSWSKPADWYVLWSAFLIGGGVLFAYPGYEWNMYGIIWWILSCFCCSVGCKIGYDHPIVYKGKKWIDLFCSRINYRIVVVVFFIMGLLYSEILLTTHGFSLFSIRSMSDLYEINNYMQGYRYSGMDTNEGIVQQICLSFTYALPICGGFLLTKKRTKKHALLCFLSLAPNFLISVLNNTKAGIILAIILFVSGFVIGYLRRYHVSPPLSGAVMKALLIGFVAFMIFIFLVIKLRYNSDADRSETNYIIATIRDYIFGCVLNFDHYFSEIKSMDLTKSYEFFPGSNVLTANTFWIHRYGYIGTLFVWGMRGFLSGTAYKAVENGDAGIVEIIILISVYLNAIYFFTHVAFSYTTVCVGVFLLFPVFLMVYKDTEISQKHLME